LHGMLAEVGKAHGSAGGRAVGALPDDVHGLLAVFRSYLKDNETEAPQNAVCLKDNETGSQR